MRRWVFLMAAAFGLSLDLSFHWVSAGFEGDPAHWQAVSLLRFLQQLLIDVDPSQVPVWVTVLGITAHVVFFASFSGAMLVALVAIWKARHPVDVPPTVPAEWNSGYMAGWEEHTRYTRHFGHVRSPLLSTVPAEWNSGYKAGWNSGYMAAWEEHTRYMRHIGHVRSPLPDGRPKILHEEER